MGNPMAVGFPAPGAAELEKLECLPLQELNSIGGGQPENRESGRRGRQCGQAGRTYVVEYVDYVDYVSPTTATSYANQLHLPVHGGRVAEYAINAFDPRTWKGTAGHKPKTRLLTGGLRQSSLNRRTRFSPSARSAAPATPGLLESAFGSHSCRLAQPPPAFGIPAGDELRAAVAD